MAQQNESAESNKVDAKAHRKQRDSDNMMKCHLPKIRTSYIEQELTKIFVLI